MDRLLFENQALLPLASYQADKGRQESVEL